MDETTGHLEKSAPREAGSHNDGRRVLLVGARGFIGSAIAKELDRGGWSATFLTRPGSGAKRESWAYADLEDPNALATACAGHDVVINAASYVGDDAQEQRRVNHIGARNLVLAAQSARVPNITYISSTSVYGGRVKNGSSELRHDIVPRSSLSQSRLEAEELVLGSGGIVLRTHLVYGPGDRFFLGPVLQAVRLLGGLIEGGDVRISAVSVEALARATLRAATTLPSVSQGQIFHAAHPQTLTVGELIAAVFQSAGRTLPANSIPAHEAFTSLARSGVTRSQFNMVASDNWVNSELLWRTLNLAPGPRIDLSQASEDWYLTLFKQNTRIQTRVI
jgi:nucleoside-diphosphate-sugar epimerase